MSSYDEHLISMAGGNGEPDLDAIQARADAATGRRQKFEDATKRFMDGYGADGSLSALIDATKNDVPGLIEDNEALLAAYRSQQAKIERVEALCADMEAQPHTELGTIPGVATILRAALTATEGA